MSLLFKGGYYFSRSAVSVGTIRINISWLEHTDMNDAYMINQEALKLIATAVTIRTNTVNTKL